ncbi:MAG: hypothetical protein ACRDKW_06400 [Actinomycetota bacterium]
MPLAEAWDSGAVGWDANRREAFANDLGYAGSLIAVSASSNRSKSDQDPAEWKPPNTAAWCTYATAWATVKITRQLSADQAELAALRTMLGHCDGEVPIPEPSPTPAPSPTPPAGVLSFSAMQCDAPALGSFGCPVHSRRPSSTARRTRNRAPWRASRRSMPRCPLRSSATKSRAACS